MDPARVTTDDLADIVRRIVLDQFPQLDGRFTTPRLGRVVGVTGQGGTASDLDARVAVDVEVLTAAGTADAQWPTITGAVWPLAWIGPQRLAGALPAVGARVRLSWLFGSPLHPVAEALGGEGFTLPQLGDDWLVHVSGTEIRVTAAGDVRITAAAGRTITLDGDSIRLGRDGATALLTADFVGHTHPTADGPSTGAAVFAGGQTLHVRGS